MRSRAVGLAVLLALGAGGCSTWRVSTAPVRETAATPRSRIRVTLRDGARMQLWNPRVERDSLVGNLEDDPSRTAFALDDVVALEVREPSTAETVRLTAIVLFGVAYAIFKVALSDS